jgi:hypothetical protein
VKPRAFHPEAKQEYTQAAEHYAAIAPELGGRFYDKMEPLIGQVRRKPETVLQHQSTGQARLARKFGSRSFERVSVLSESA